MEGCGQICQTQDKDQEQVLVNTVMYLQVLSHAECQPLPVILKQTKISRLSLSTVTTSYLKTVEDLASEITRISNILQKLTMSPIHLISVSLYSYDGYLDFK
jgi:hypothetical protein